MRSQHVLDLVNDWLDHLDIAVAEANGMMKTLMAHPRRGNDNCLCEEGIGDIDRSFLEISDAGQVPADFFNVPFNLFIRDVDPFANRKRAG